MLSDTAKETLCLGMATTFQQTSSSWTLSVYIDTHEALTLRENPVHHDASEPIEVRYHFVRDSIRGNKLTLEKISTSDNVVDAMTKSLLADPKP